VTSSTKNAPQADTALTLRSITRLSQIDPTAWDAIANPPGAEYDPFLSWNFLQALEESGCAIEETGWGPRHLLLEDNDGKLQGALPLYVKGHSQGEYVFDHAWADALQRAGGQYYPKLLTAIPFTPATGRRILARTQKNRLILMQGAQQCALQWGASGWHINFPVADEADELNRAGLLPRLDRQFVWQDNGYASYDDFLAALSSRKRKALRKERREAQAGLEIESLSGDDLQPEHWDVFFNCYQQTGSRKWGYPYLNREFFNLIHQRMPADILLVLAKREGRYIAAALNFIGSDALYGRYWGRLEEHPHLHFELCYHQAIDAAIARGLSRVEAGAQGEHKLARGYRAQAVHSAHWIAHEGLRGAVGDYLDQERAAMSHEIELLAQESPFKADIASSAPARAEETNA
jgi:predicted N-acyltransferase